MANEIKKFDVVLGFDFSDNAKLALSEALALASLNKVAALHVIGVLEQPRVIGRVTQAGVSFQAAEEAQKEIAEIVHAATRELDTDLFKLFVHARIGDPTKEILGLAHEIGADLIVVGTHGRRGIQRMLMGSVAEKIVRYASCPVLVMRPTEGAPAINAEFQPEPPCPACIEQRNASNGATWWCNVHAEESTNPHPYHFSGERKKTGVSAWEFYNR